MTNRTELVENATLHHRRCGTLADDREVAPWTRNGGGESKNSSTRPWSGCRKRDKPTSGLPAKTTPRSYGKSSYYSRRKNKPGASWNGRRLTTLRPRWRPEETFRAGNLDPFGSCLL